MQTEDDLSVPPELPDAVLVIRCQLGDPAAWGLLVDRWHTRLWRFLSRMLSERHAVEDALQSVWLRIIRSLIQLEDPERAAPWFYGIARRTVADRLRAQYRRPLADELVDVADDDDGLQSLELTEALHAALATLHPADREAVVLHYLEELPLAEVAEICGVPAGTIKSRLYRGRKILRNALQ